MKLSSTPTNPEFFFKIKFILKDFYQISKDSKTTPINDYKIEKIEQKKFFFFFLTLKQLEVLLLP